MRLLLVPLTALVLFACASSDDPAPVGSILGAPGERGGAPSVTTTTPQPGQGEGGMTAGDFDDNLNYGLFTRYVARARAKRPQSPTLDPTGRITIAVDDGGGTPVPFAPLRVLEGGRALFEGTTDSAGQALFFPRIDGAQGGALTLEIGAGAGAVQLQPTSTTAWTASLPGAATALPPSLDLAFVIDTTGSMGDELAYVTAEVSDMVSRIQAMFPRVDIRFALVVYRDEGDDYVAQGHDFTTDLPAFQALLARQSADGGGDYPEAMDAGLAAMNQLAWRSGNVARVAFLIADAPPQPGDEAAFLDHALVSRRAGVKLYPVAASGTADEAEFVMRWAAVLTRARYVFLTDDSGIGAPHAEPDFPCYQVLQFDNVVVRAVASELRGVRMRAADADVIREVGAPADGACTLADGTVVHL